MGGRQLQVVVLQKSLIIPGLCGGFMLAVGFAFVSVEVSVETGEK